MRKIFTVICLFLMVISSFSWAEVTPFLTEDEISCGEEFLSLPPAPTDPSFYNDKYRYEWGKTVRDTPRGQQAVADAVHTLEYFSLIYSEPFGIEISKKNTPEIYALLNRLLATTEVFIDKAKRRIMRKRPYVQFNEPTPVPQDEDRLRNNSSYPSGHTTMGWGIALVLAEINPLNQDAILKRGFEYGQSRVIVGFHYQSDVDDARLITSILLNRLHVNEEFMTQLQKAKDEFLKKKTLAQQKS